MPAEGRGGGGRKPVRGCRGGPKLRLAIPEVGGLVGELGSLPLAFSVATAGSLAILLKMISRSSGGGHTSVKMGLLSKLVVRVAVCVNGAVQLLKRH